MYRDMANYVAVMVYKVSRCLSRRYLHGDEATVIADQWQLVSAAKSSSAALESIQI
jgi:hypothetical protein